MMGPNIKEIFDLIAYTGRAAGARAREMCMRASLPRLIFSKVLLHMYPPPHMTHMCTGASFRLVFSKVLYIVTFLLFMNIYILCYYYSRRGTSSKVLYTVIFL